MVGEQDDILILAAMIRISVMHTQHSAILDEVTVLNFFEVPLHTAFHVLAP